jgi:hypothetical protein
MRLRETKWRWTWLVIYAVTSGLTVPFWVWGIQSLCEYALPAEWPMAFFLRYFIGFGFLVWMLRLLRPRRGHFLCGRWLRYPSLISAVPLSGLVCSGIAMIGESSLNFSQNAATQDAWWSAAIASACVSISLGIWFWWPRTNNLEEIESNADLFESQLPSLEITENTTVQERAAAVLAWAKDEAPISGRTSDMFRAHERAIRILDALRTERTDQKSAEFCQTVVIQGRFGSGKSSLMRLVMEEALRRGQNDLIFVELNCWGFEKGTRVVEHVLSECVDALHEYVDCTTIRSAPAAYARAIAENTNSWLTSLLGMFKGGEDPASQIERFAPLLAAANLHLVAIIEDTDRNGLDFDVGQIEALLHQFRRVNRMSFILSAGETSRIEFPKVAEHIEFLPAVPKKTTLAVIDAIRAAIRNDGSWIDPVIIGNTEGKSERNRIDSLQGEAQAGDWSWKTFGSSYPTWPEAIARLLETPRALKLVVRAYARAWGKLRGEVDVDELLMVLVLRHAAPGVFSFLGRNLVRLRSLGKGRHSDSEENKAQIEELVSDWKATIASANIHADSALTILVELIPNAGTLLGLKTFNHGNRVQSLRNEDGPDYWDRMSAEALMRDEVSDQTVLAALVAVPNSPEGVSGLADLMMREPRTGALVNFFVEHSSLARGQEEAIQSGLLEKIRETFGNKANDRTPAYASLGWGLVKRFSYDDGRLNPWLIRELEACFPGHIRLACELTGDHGRKTPMFRRELIRLARMHFENVRGEKLAAGLDRDFPWTLYHLLFAFGEGPPEIMLTRGVDWEFLTPVIIDGIKTHPRIVGLAAARTFFQSASPDVKLKALDFRTDDVSDYFGDQTKEFYALISGISPLVFADTSWAEFMNHAAECAKKHIQQHDS